jgi:hypothetical protein
MRLIKTIEVTSGGTSRRIELLLGDLTEMPPEHAVDVLVVSAFPGDYRPYPGTLVAALDAKNVFLDSLLENAEADLRKDFGCWLSRPIAKRPRGLEFSRVLGFEPLLRGSPSEVVSDIFRALAPFVHASPSIRSVAMPIVAAGQQGVPISSMLPALMEAAWNQLSAGLPLDVVKIVVFDKEKLKDAKRLFIPPKKDHVLFSFGRRQPDAAPPSRDRLCDVFISYSREDQAAAHHFASALSKAGIRPFVDTLQINVGASWQQRIWDALAGSTRTAVFYSPSFLTSKVCQDEFNTAMILRRRRTDSFIFPVLVRDCDLPAHMEMLNFHDCRPSDKDRLSAAAETLVASLRE